MVFMPPRHGKSEEISRLFSAYYLYRHPDRWVGINSYAAELAYTLSRAAREAFTRVGGIIKSTASAVKHWETTERGGLWAAGVGGPITGKGFHLGIIDDPLKNAEDAASELIREKQKDWYRSTFSTRAEPGAATVIVQTRWNEDDLSGWLLSQEDDEEPEHWYIVNLPAIAEPLPDYPPQCKLHLDWRADGEPLCPERYPLAKLAKIANRIGDYFWAALFQQRPRARAGGMFKTGRVGYVDAVPSGAMWIRSWDIAASAGKGDYTAGVLMARSGDRYYVADVLMGQWGTDERDATIKATAEADRSAHGRMLTLVPQDPAAAGKSMALGLIRLLAGFNAESVLESGDKETRADAYSAQWNAGDGQNTWTVALVRDRPERQWNTRYLEIMTGFPNGKIKDPVDASSNGFNRLAARNVIRAMPSVATKKSVWS